MKFFDQLKLLVWKNFTLRKRQHLRNVVEIVWPLVLFIILVAVRNRQNYGATNKPASIYRPRALPSAGLFPFVRSFLCDFKSTRTDDPSEILNGLPDLRSSSLGRLFEDGLPILTNSSLQERLLRVNEDYRRFTADSKLWNDLMNNSSRPVQWNGYNLSAVPLDKLLKDPAQFQEFLYKTTKLSPRVVAELFNSTVNVQKIAGLVEPYRSLSQESLSWFPRNPLEIGNLLLPSSSNNQPVNLFWSLLLMRIASTIQSQGTISGSEVKFIICDSRSPANLQEILNGPGNVTEVKTALCKLNNTVLGELGKELQTQIKWPNITDYQGHQRNLSKLLRSLQDDVRNLNEDVQALQAFQQVTEDYLSVMQDLQAGGFQATLCGRSLSADNDEDNQNNGNGGTSNGVIPAASAGLLAGLCGYSRYPNGTFYKSADSHPLDYYLNLTQNMNLAGDDSEEENDDTEKHRDQNCPRLAVEYSKYNVTGRQDTCSIIQPLSRVDCGWPGISEDKCVQMGCCFDSSIAGARYCFYKAENAVCNCFLGQIVRTAGGVTGNAGKGRRDSGFVELASLFLKGKILYTPDNNVTRYIVSQIKNELSGITRIKDFAYWWVNNSEANHKRITEYVDTYLKRPLPEGVCDSADLFLDDANQRWPDRVPELSFNSSRKNISILPPSFNTSAVLSNLDFLFQTIIRIYTCTEHEYFEGYKDEESLVKRAMNASQVPTIASLVFEYSSGDLTKVPKYVKYKIRQDVDYTPRTDRIRRWYWRPGPLHWWSYQGYFNFGFLYLQDLIDRALMNLMLNETIAEPGVYLQEFPYPCYIEDKFVRYIGGTMPLFMTLAWIFSVAMIIRGVVYEKELRLKEVMKVMGLGNAVHWVAWFINSSALMVITISLLVAVLKGGKILWHSNPAVIFLFLLVFMTATIMLCFLISVFFARANVAAACGGIFFFVTYLPYVVVRWYEQFMTTGQKAAASLLSTTSFGLSCSYLARYEEQGVGAQWSNLFSSPVAGDGFSLGYAMVMMMMDAIIYGVLTWYIEAVMPGQYGIPRPWYFPFQKSYWFEVANKRVLEVDAATGDQRPSHSAGRGGASYRGWTGGMDEVAFQDFERGCVTEKEPTHLPLGCSIKRLVKIYKDGNKLAVDGLNLNLYQGQITSFLGHNGAGKTTTMSVLTGLFPPTSGTAIINGHDIRKDIDLVRKSLGICPQYNVLFSGLTVSEHLWFYASLKGMAKADIPDEIERFLKDVGLENKRDELARCLSGGMKRKLSVALAFVAGSKVVILDEPTAGVDPFARRGIWDLLLHYKSGRTVLLSTHHMDEADILGDRIAIISQGKLQCCGSSLFLKGHYGNGYYVTLTKKAPEERPSTARTLKDVNVGPLIPSIPSIGSSLDEGVGMDSLDASELESLSSMPGTSSSDPTLQDTEVFCNESLVTSFFKSYIPSAQLVENIGSELTYVLPAEMAREGRFQDLFEELDRNLDKLHIGSYGVSDTTLEEVFLKVAEEANAEEEDMLAAEMPKRRPSFRTQLSRTSRISDSFTDRDQLLADTSEELDGELEDIPPSVFESTDGGYDADKQLGGIKLLKGQFWALIVKRFHHLRRNRKAFISQILLPAIFVCLAMIVSQIRPFSEMPALELNTNMFLKVDPHEHYVPFAEDGDRRTFMTRDMTDNLVHYPGVGTSCLEKTCSRKSINFTSNPTEPVSTLQCDCESTGTAKCPSGAGGPKPSQWQSFTGDKLQNLTGRNMTDYLLKTYGNFIRKRYGGVTFGDNFKNLPSSFTRSNVTSRGIIKEHNAKAWYNTKGYHAAPTFLNILNNVILRSKAAEKGLNASQFGINTINHPMNYTKEQLSDETFFNRVVDVLVAICVVFALSFVPASFIVYLVNERNCKAKHLHLVSGVRPYVYWLSTYVWDLVNYIIPALCCIFIFLAFGEDAYTSSMNFPPTFLLLLLYGWAITPLMYPASFLFSESSTAYIVLICVNLFIGINTTLATFILEFFTDDTELIAINDMLKRIFLIFPNYCLGRGLIDLAKNQFMDVFDRFGQDLVRDPFSWDITGRNILMMIIQGFLFFFLTILIEYRFFLPQRRIKTALKPLDKEDEDVEKERERIERGGGINDILRLDNLTKVYKSRNRQNVAVNRLCIGVPKGECFGLLGVNGAGKTSTFKMLTGDISVSSGEAFVDGYSILTNIHNAHQSMGYCPQFDGLDSLLTASEHLRLYARLRGVPEKHIKQVVDSLIARMNLTEYANRCAGGFSGGNKRKLSTAIALVGNPPIIFLDEPTTGMDPKARRFLWDIITGIVKEGRTVILTSHSMEECESLCSRVAIMVNGQFKCLGSPQHLKCKFGDGYTVTLRVGGENPDLEGVSEFIKSLFPTAILKDQHHNQLQYQFPSQGLLLSSVFGHLEANRKIFQIEDYSVSQTTLDQVFINFAKNQTDGMGEDALSAAPELEEPLPYNDDEAGPRVSFVRMSDFTPGSVDV